MHAVLAVVLLCAQVETKAETPPAVTMAEYMHKVCNAHRAKHGLPPLALDEGCNRISQNWSNYMAANYAFHHGGGENIIAYGTTTPEATMQMWMESPGHRAFMLSRSTHVGWGCQRAANGTWYWSGTFRSGPVAKPSAAATMAGGGR